MVAAERRAALVAAGLAGSLGLSGLCACAAASGGSAAASGLPLHRRTLQGGFLPRKTAGKDDAAGPSNGMFVRWMVPGALALRGTDLLLADVGTARLWRADITGSAIIEVEGAPVGAQMSLALGPDLSAWVLDPPARQVLRFARDGRLLQRHHVGADVGRPVALALAPDGTTLLLADAAGASAGWAELAVSGGPPRRVAPARAGGQRLGGVDALAVGRGGVFVLDRAAGAVHRVSRRGAVLQTLGVGDLQRPLAIAVDEQDRVYVHEGQDGSIKRLAAGWPTRRWSAADLGVEQIGGLAVGAGLLAISDAQAGTVVLHSLASGGSS